MEKQPYRTRKLWCVSLHLTNCSLGHFKLICSQHGERYFIFGIATERVPNHRNSKIKTKQKQTWGLYGLIWSLLISLSCDSILIFADGWYPLWGQENLQRMRQGWQPPDKNSLYVVNCSAPWPQTHRATAGTAYPAVRYHKLQCAIRHLALWCSDCKSVSCMFSQIGPDLRAGPVSNLATLPLYKGHLPDIDSRISLEQKPK